MKLSHDLVRTIRGQLPILEYLFWCIVVCLTLVASVVHMILALFSGVANAALVERAIPEQTALPLPAHTFREPTPPRALLVNGQHLGMRVLESTGSVTDVLDAYTKAFPREGRLSSEAIEAWVKQQPGPDQASLREVLGDIQTLFAPQILVAGRATGTESPSISSSTVPSFEAGGAAWFVGLSPRLPGLKVTPGREIAIVMDWASNDEATALPLPENVVMMLALPSPDRKGSTVIHLTPEPGFDPERLAGILDQDVPGDDPNWLHRPPALVRQMSFLETSPMGVWRLTSYRARMTPQQLLDTLTMDHSSNEQKRFVGQWRRDGTARQWVGSLAGNTSIQLIIGPGNVPTESVFTCIEFGI